MKARFYFTEKRAYRMAQQSDFQAVQEHDNSFENKLL